MISKAGTELPAGHARWRYAFFRTRYRSRRIPGRSGE